MTRTSIRAGNEMLDSEIPYIALAAAIGKRPKGL